jgi:hypothetical protein
LALVAGAEGQWVRALRLAGAAEAVVAAAGPAEGPALLEPVEVGMIEAEVAQVRAQGRAALSEGAVARPWAEGRAMTLEQAVAYALEDGPDAA